MAAEKFSSVAEYKPHLSDKLSLSTLWVNDIFCKPMSQIPITIQLE